MKRQAMAAALLAFVAAGAARAAGDPEMPGEVIVKLASASALQPLLAKLGLSVAGQLGARPVYRLKVAGLADTHAVIDALRLEADVLLAEPNVIHGNPEARKNGAWAIGSPDAYAAQWAPRALRLAQAQRVSIGAGVRVAVLDTGVDPQHPALAGRLLPGRDFVDGDNDPTEAGSRLDAAFGHGTHVAGIVAMVAPGARIMALRVLDPSGQGDAWTIAQAVLHAVDPDGNPDTDDGAHVINLSLGSTVRTRIFDTIARLAACTAASGPTGRADDVSDPGYNDDKARCANFGGAVVAAAAGNDASDAVRQYPAAEGAYGLIAVGASNADGRLAGFSNFGSWVQVTAPGDGITSSVPGGIYGTWSGTSMAAPMAAGIAALVRAAAPSLASDDVARRVVRMTSNLCGTNLRQVDAAAAVTNQQPEDRVCP